MLTNNIALAGVSLIDDHGGGHKIFLDHDSETNTSDHCSHLQSHFYNILVSNNFSLSSVKVMRLTPHKDTHHILLSYIPPVPPPKF